MTLRFSGEITLDRQTFVELLRDAMPTSHAENRPRALEPNGKPRLAYSIREVAEMLGLSEKTVYRFVQRGLLRCPSVCRHKLITKAELDRFLKQTLSA